MVSFSHSDEEKDFRTIVERKGKPINHLSYLEIRYSTQVTSFESIESPACAWTGYSKQFQIYMASLWNTQVVAKALLMSVSTGMESSNCRCCEMSQESIYTSWFAHIVMSSTRNCAAGTRAQFGFTDTTRCPQQSTVALFSAPSGKIEKLILFPWRP